MSFICVFSKQNNPEFADETELDTVDKARLETLLCPYIGDVYRVDVVNSQLYVSSNADLYSVDKNRDVSAVCDIPRNTQKNPQTSWLEVTSTTNRLIFKTDPLGTFPLWVFDDEHRIVITSEVKSLLALVDSVKVELNHSELEKQGKRPANFSPYKNVRRVKPGATLEISDQGVLMESGDFPLVYHPASMFPSIEKSKEALSAALTASSKTIGQKNGSWGAFLSGGIDSSSATALLNRIHPGLQTYTLGTEFGDEYSDAAELATYLNTPHTKVFAKSDEAMSHFERAVFCNETVDGLTAETVAQLSVLSQSAVDNAEFIITGYGADLLFGSMLRHELYMKVTGVDGLQSLIERTCWSGEFSPFFAWSLGIEIHHLFWDPDVMNCAFRIPDEYNFDGEHEKVALRTLAVEGELMKQSHAFRKKHAMTDGTQFNRVLSNALALDDNYSYDRKSDRCIALLTEIFNQ